MSYTLPTQGGKWRVGQNGFADIVRTRNIDFDTTGALTLAKEPINLYSTTDDADFGVVKAIVNNFVFTAGNVFKFNPGDGTMTEQSTTSMPNLLGTSTDAVAYDGEYSVSDDQTVASYDGVSTWTANATTGLTTGEPHPLCVFEDRVTLCIGNGNHVVQTTAGTHTADSGNSLTIPNDYLVTWMRWLGNNLYIGTRNTAGGEAKMFIWNGSGTKFQQGYPIGADWAYSGCAYQSSIVILTSAGQLLRFNGGGFTELAHFPVYETSYSWSVSSAAAGNTDGNCANRGMIVIGDKLFININGIVTAPSGEKYLASQPSGLWVYDPSVGLYHRAGHTYSKYNTLTVTSLAANVLTTATHGLETGDSVYATSVSNITGLTAGQVYYAVKVSTTTFSLALSPADALNGRVVTLSGTPSGDTVYVNRNQPGAVAQTATVFARAIAPITTPIAGSSKTFFTSGLLFSAGVTTASNTSISTLMSLGTGRNVGHFVTSDIPAAAIKDTFQKLYFNLKDLSLDTDKIVVKYRTVSKYGLPTPYRLSDTGMATWVDASSFTILSTAKDVKSAAVGDEVEIIEGAGAGFTAHITSIDTSTSTYSYVLDESIPGIAAGNLSDVSIDNWTKLGSIDNARDTINEGYAEIGLGKKAASVQFKIELRGHGVAIDKLSIITTEDKKA